MSTIPLITLSTLAREYNSTVEEKWQVEDKLYKQVCYLFNKKMSTLMIEKGEKFKLPDKMGELSVGKNRMKYERLHVDYATLNRTGKLAYHVNDHSDNFYAFPRWNKTKARMINQEYYGFKFTRTNSRELASKMKSRNGHHVFEIATRKDAV